MEKYHIKIEEQVFNGYDIEAESLEDAICDAIINYSKHNKNTEMKEENKILTKIDINPYSKNIKDFNMTLDYSNECNKLKIKSKNLVDREHSCNNTEEFKKIIEKTILEMQEKDLKNRNEFAKKNKDKEIAR